MKPTGSRSLVNNMPSKLQQNQQQHCFSSSLNHTTLSHHFIRPRTTETEFTPSHQSQNITGTTPQPHHFSFTTFTTTSHRFIPHNQPLPLKFHRSQHQHRNNLNATHPSPYTTQVRGYRNVEAHPRSPTDPYNYNLANAEVTYGKFRSPDDLFGPAKARVSGSTDRFFYDYHPSLDRLMEKTGSREDRRRHARRFRDNEWVHSNILSNQAILNENVRQLENTALREKIYGAKDMWNRDDYQHKDLNYRKFEQRQRELLAKIYKQQIEAVIDEFEHDYAPLVAIHLRKQKRALFWRKVRQRTKFLAYPISLSFNALTIAYKIWRRRRDLDTRVGPRVVSELEFKSIKRTLFFLRKGSYKGILREPVARFATRMSTLFTTQRELLHQRAMTMETELLRFHKHSNVNSAKDLIHWFTQRSKYDPVQYELRQQITNNLTEGFKGLKKPDRAAPKHYTEYILDPTNPTMTLSKEDSSKLLLRLFHRFVLHFRLTASSYAEQKWFVRKIRELIDGWYDFYRPMFFMRFIVWRKAFMRRKIDKLIEKEVYKRQKLEQKMLRDLKVGKNPNSLRNIIDGIKHHRSLTKYLSYRLKLWFNSRRHATLYDVAKKNRRWFEGPSGPPFWRIYLQTKHLLRSPLGRLRMEKLTVGQEDAKSFWRKWSDMTHDMRKYPKLRSIIWSTAHDNLMLRSTLYFRLTRYLRNKRPQIDEVKEEYFSEVIRVFNAIFFKKERYSFQELYALSLQEWWYPTQNSIKKFDRFDQRTYDRWNLTDTSVLFSVSTLFLSTVLFSISYAYSMGLRERYKTVKAEQEKYLYTQDGADIGHYASQLLFADRRDLIINELKYNGLMRLHDEINSRAGRLIDAYYAVLDDSRRERYFKHEPATTIVYIREELANIANAMKGKARDYELADDLIIEHVQRLWYDAAEIFARSSDVSYNPYAYPEDERQEHADIGHFLMTHIDKIAQSASFPELEGESKLSYILDDGLIKVKSEKGERGGYTERALSQEQEERLAKTGEQGTHGPTKYLALSEAVQYLDHSDECALAKLGRLECNLQMLLQLLDAITKIQDAMEEHETEEYRILEIPSPKELSDMQVAGTFDSFLHDWHKKQRQLLPHIMMPPEFGALKAKQILKETGNKHAALTWLHYYNRYVKPGVYNIPVGEFGTTLDVFELDESTLAAQDELLHQINNIESSVERRMRIFRPHVNNIMRNVNRLVQLRPRIYKEVKNQMVSKFIGLVDLDPEVPEEQTHPGALLDFWIAKRRMARFAQTYLGGSIQELDFEHRVPLMMLEEMQLRQQMRGNTRAGTRSRTLRDLALTPSEALKAGITPEKQRAIDEEFGSEDLAREERAQNMTRGMRRAIAYTDESFNITFTPDNWSTRYEPMLLGWNVEELEQRRKTFMQFFMGHLPTQISTDPSPRAQEWLYQSVTPFDENSYYDAWTDIYQLTARVKNRIDPNYAPKEVREALPWHNLWTFERQTDPYDRPTLASLARKIPETYRYKYDTYQMRTYGTDHEFWYNRKLFYERIDRYFRYFKFFLNRQWSRDILDENQRWRKFKRFITGDKKKVSFYEDYFLSHGFYHFLTKDPVYARYGNDFFFRYFIDAPRFDRRPMALVDRHRYDKDGEDIYFDALYNSRVLNNPWPLHIEHMAWSLKPWYDFVNAQFAVYRYLILTDGDYPTEFPQMYIEDVENIEKFVVPDQHFGYDAIWTWGKDLFDTTYKKQKQRHADLVKKLMPNESWRHPRPNFLDFHENYVP